MGPAGSAVAMVYLHGLCGDPLAFRAWMEAAAVHGTLISMRGDEPCPGRGGRTKWSFDYRRLDARITRAITTVSARRETPLDLDEVVAIGYSQGAHRVHWLAARYPDRYRRVVVIAMTTPPLATHFARAERVLIMAGGRDARQHLYEGHLELRKAGVVSRYAEFPGARHGEYGEKAEATMTDALGWLFADRL
ncbi:MAG: alpha/beta fold hydrolase [Myxococcota bacterium]